MVSEDEGVHIAELEDIRARADVLRAKTIDIAQRLQPIDVQPNTRTMINVQQQDGRVIE